MFEGNRHVFLKVMDKLRLFSYVLFMSPHVFVPDFHVSWPSLAMVNKRSPGCLGMFRVYR